ncbi:MAG: ECF-type sigma factor, partial [Gemmatimonadota bacterium]|nr:ECF-type sigma factor [Gemmatimonadota bacterium]
MKPVHDGVPEVSLEPEAGVRCVDRMMPRVYAELRGIAHRYLAADPDGHTLSTTALIHEAYLRLADADQVSERGRAYFFASAARAMRRVLVDYARRRRRLKRGGGRSVLTLNDGMIATTERSVDLVDLDHALVLLA